MPIFLFNLTCDVNKSLLLVLFTGSAFQNLDLVDWLTANSFHFDKCLRESVVVGV